MGVKTTKAASGELAAGARQLQSGAHYSASESFRKLLDDFWTQWPGGNGAGRTALHVVLALAAKSEEYGGFPYVDASTRDIELWTGLSDTTVARALETLDQCDVVTKSQGAAYGRAPGWKVSIFEAHYNKLISSVLQFYSLGDTDALGGDAFLVFLLLDSERRTVTECASALHMTRKTARKNLLLLEEHGLAVASWRAGGAKIATVLEALGLEDARQERRERIEQEREDFRRGAEQAARAWDYRFEPDPDHVELVKRAIAGRLAQKKPTDFIFGEVKFARFEAGELAAVTGLNDFEAYWSACEIGRGDEYHVARGNHAERPEEIKLWAVRAEALPILEKFEDWIDTD